MPLRPLGPWRPWPSWRSQRRRTHSTRALLTLLEEDLVPLFYARDSAGLPRGWLAKARRSFVTIPGRFNTHRMVGESLRDAYVR